MVGAIKVGKGRYRYKGYKLYSYGYYAPDRCIWWEASDDETGCAVYYAHTKRELMGMIDKKR